MTVKGRYVMLRSGEQVRLPVKYRLPVSGATFWVDTQEGAERLDAVWGRERRA